MCLLPLEEQGYVVSSLQVSVLSRKSVNLFLLWLSEFISWRNDLTVKMRKTLKVTRLCYDSISVHSDEASYAWKKLCIKSGSLNSITAYELEESGNASTVYNYEFFLSSCLHLMNESITFISFKHCQSYNRFKCVNFRLCRDVVLALSSCSMPGVRITLCCTHTCRYPSATLIYVSLPPTFSYGMIKPKYVIENDRRLMTHRKFE